MKNDNLIEIIKLMNIKISHLEDIEADNRELLVKVIKQGNQIVEFLKGCDVEVEEEINEFMPINDSVDKEKYERLTNLFSEFMEKRKDLKEFEEEMKKYKNDITPGIIGES